jgi:hypothetical protein
MDLSSCSLELLGCVVASRYYRTRPALVQHMMARFCELDSAAKLEGLEISTPFDTDYYMYYWGVAGPLPRTGPIPPGVRPVKRGIYWRRGAGLSPYRHFKPAGAPPNTSTRQTVPSTRPPLGPGPLALQPSTPPETPSTTLTIGTDSLDGSWLQPSTECVNPSETLSGGGSCSDVAGLQPSTAFVNPSVPLSGGVPCSDGPGLQPTPRLETQPPTLPSWADSHDGLGLQTSSEPGAPRIHDPTLWADAPDFVMGHSREVRRNTDSSSWKPLTEREKMAYRYRDLKFMATHVHMQTPMLATLKLGIPIWERWLTAWNSPLKRCSARIPQPYAEGVLAVLDYLARLLTAGLMEPLVKKALSQDYLIGLERALKGPLAKPYMLHSRLTRLDKDRLLALYSSIDAQWIHSLLTDGLKPFHAVVFAI